MITKLEISNELKNEMTGEIEVDLELLTDWSQLYIDEALCRVIGNSFTSHIIEEHQKVVIINVKEIEFYNIRKRTCGNSFKPLAIMNFKLTLDFDNNNGVDLEKYETDNNYEYECNSIIGKLILNEFGSKLMR